MIVGGATGNRVKYEATENKEANEDEDKKKHNIFWFKTKIYFKTARFGGKNNTLKITATAAAGAVPNEAGKFFSVCFCSNIKEVTKAKNRKNDKKIVYDRIAAR